MNSDATGPRPPAGPSTPPPPPAPKPSKLDERMERAIKAACQGPPFPAEVIAALRSLLPPVTR